MPLPAYTEILATDEFKALDEDKKAALTDKYWADYASENTKAAPEVGAKVLGYEIRQPYPAEDDFFKKRPEVAGMAAEDGKITLNPYSPLSADQKAAVAKNEALRLKMEDDNVDFDFALSPQQRAAFSDTEYATDDKALRRTIVARVLSGDASAEATPEQVLAAEEFSKQIKDTPDDPALAAYVARQRETSGAYLTARAAREDASPVARRFAERDLADAAFALKLSEAQRNGALAPADAKAAVTLYQERNAERDAKLAKTASLFDPKVAAGMSPAFEAMQGLAIRGGKFGSPSLDARMSDILPFGEQDAVKNSGAAYDALRKQMATDFHLEEAEVDDVIKHQLNLQSEPVSRDAFGTPHIKNEVLAQGNDATIAAINTSTLPWREKQRLVADLPKRLDAFKDDVLKSVQENDPILAERLGLATARLEPKPGTEEFEIKRTPITPADPAARDEQFNRLLGVLNRTPLTQAMSGARAGQASSDEILQTPSAFLDITNPAGRGRPIGYDAGAEKSYQESVIRLSSDFNKAKTQVFGTDAAAFGQGAQSVAEAVAIGTVTAGLGLEPFAAARIAQMGKTGQVLANGINRAVAVSPVAALGAGKSAMSTYDSAIAAGKTDEEATGLAWKSGLIEFGVTGTMSALGLGGTESVGDQLVRPVVRNAVRANAKKAFDSFGGKLVKGLAAEQFEENMITALDSVMVQAKINPDMTVEDFTKSLKDTALVTLGVSGPTIAAGSFAETRQKPTYEQTTGQLEVSANLALGELSNEVDPGTEAAVESPEAGTPPGPGVPAVATVETGVPAAVAAEPQAAPVAPEPPTPLTDATEVLDPAPVAEGLPGTDERTLAEAPASEVSAPIEDVPVEAVAPEISTPDSSTESGPPAATVAGQTSPATTPSNETEVEGQRQGRQEVLTPEGDAAPGQNEGQPIARKAEKTSEPVVPKVDTPADKPAPPGTVEAPSKKPVQEADPAPAPVEPDVKPEAVPKTRQESGTEEEPVQLRNAYVDANRQRQKLPERFRPAREANQDAWDKALKRYEKDPDAGKILLEDLKQKPRALDPTDNAVLLHEQVTRELALDKAHDRLESATDENRVLRLKEVEDAETALTEYYDVEQAAGTAAGRSLQARKMGANRDFTLARMTAVVQKEVNQGAPLSAQQRTEVKALHDKITELEKQVEEANARQSESTAKQTFDKAVRELKAAGKESRKQGEKPLSFLERQAEAARARILARQREGRLNALPVNELLDHAIIGLSYIAKGASKLKDFTVELVKDFGEKMRPFAGEIFEKSQELQNRAAPVPKLKTREQVLEDLDGSQPLTGKTIYDLARSYINAGMDGFENVMAAVLSDLQSTYPDLTLREVHDTYSGYGKTMFPSKAEDKTKLREYRALARLTSQLEDAQKRLAPKRTGLQRDTPTERVRTLQKQVKATMRRLGIKPSGRKGDLRTSLDSVKARLRNEIEDLDTAITERRPRPESRTPVEYDQEAKDLKARRDARKAEYDAIFGKKGLTDEDRVKLAIKSLNGRIAEEERLLAAGLLKRESTNDRSAWSPEIAELQGKLDKLRDERRKLREAARPKKDPAVRAYDRALKAVESSIKRYEDALSGKAPAKANLPSFSPTNEYLRLIRERGRLRDLVAELKKQNAPKPVSKEERERAAATRALVKAIADLETRIRTGNLAPNPKATPKASADAHVEHLRATRKRLGKTLAELRRAALPKKDPYQVRLDRDKKMIQTRINKLEAKLAAGDYTKPVKPDPAMDKEKEDLQLKEFTLKREFNEKILGAKLAQRSPLKKAFDTAMDATFLLHRALITSYDLGHFNRQAGLVNFSRPEISWRNKKSLLSFSEKTSNRYRAKLEGLDDAGKALFKRAKDAGLALSDWRPGHKLSEMEEEHRSRLAKKIPGVVQSERAYVTYLNEIRFDYFNTLAKGIDPTDKAGLKELANHVNNFTGRGSLGRFENAANGLAGLLFSPKYWVSRLRVIANAGAVVPLGVATGFRIHPKEIRAARKLIAKEYARLSLGYTAFYGLLALAKFMVSDDDEKEPFKVGTDPTSSDFGKVVWSNGSRSDPLAGLSQNLVFLARQWTGKSTSSTGEVTDLEDPKSPLTRGDVAIRMLRTKAAPLAGAVANLAFRQDLGYKPARWEKELLGLFMPIQASETYAGYQELGAAGGTAAFLSNTFGLGLSSYGENIEDADAREDFLTMVNYLSGGKFGWTKERYSKDSGKSGPKLPKLPKLPSLPKPPRLPR